MAYAANTPLAREPEVLAHLLNTSSAAALTFIKQIRYVTFLLRVRGNTKVERTTLARRRALDRLLRTWSRSRT